MKIEVKHGSFSYRKDVPVIKDMNFEAHSGELVAILGPNGAGKTTLLRCIMGFLSWDGGASMIDGEDISTMSPRKLWQRAAYVPQAKNIFTALKVGDMILLGCTNRMGMFAVPGEKEKEQVQIVAGQLKITHLLHKRCNEISGGELQMVLIARALAAHPELLILDEPESNLDFKNQLIILDTMSELTEKGMCCLFNTHYPTHALMRAGKALILKRGGDSIFGNTVEIVTESNIEQAFGVEAVIGEIETPGNIYRNVLPLRLSRTQKNKTDSVPAAPENVIAVISMIFSDFSLAEKLNRLIHNYSNYIIGRMGMPYQEGGVYILHITLDAPEKEIQILSHQLGLFQGIQVKTTLAEKECRKDEGESGTYPPIG